MEKDNVYEKAIDKVKKDSQLRPYYHALVGYPQDQTDHFLWVINASVQELLDWIEALSEAKNDYSS